VELNWAHAGPGWPDEGGDWFKAQQVCSNLSEDSIPVESTPEYIWRLPTVDEAVRSMALHGQNSGGNGMLILERLGMKPSRLKNLRCGTYIPR